MLINKAYAAAAENAGQFEGLADPAASGEGLFFWNIAFVFVVVFLFYVLLIMPQQRRIREHSEMLSELKKGDRVVTGGGLVGKVDKFVNDREVLIDLGNGVKVTALRSSLQGKTDDILRPVANDTSTAKTEKK
ncbi:MAG: preprotein translocase subunit YajC [Alphaproteobacteria bacterium]|nr:preprotein translocase subunit YajC [Alphaproteobacteria bacterium]MCB9974567.1 preprotein translocase subunit YajC [Rhodospirillales bacterium]